MDGICIHTRCIVLSMLCLLIYITAVSIRDEFKQVLKRNLGNEWYQLASAMGLPKTVRDGIKGQDIPLSGKIDEFLQNYKFPAFRSDEETTKFLVEALERACLPYIAASVRRDLKNALQCEGIFVCMQPCVILS